MEHSAARAWAYEEFGDIKLGDARLRRRIVTTATGALMRPRATITATFGKGAAAEGAFRMLSNDEVRSETLSDASHRATARRCDAHSLVVVPVDGTSIRIRDTWDLRGLGPLSSLTDKARGIQALHALAVAPDGTTLGVVGRQFWLRSKTSTRGSRVKNFGPRKDRESYRWVTMLESVTRDLQAQAPGTTPWFQIDRGGDCWMVLQHAVKNGLTLTVRANQNRTLAPRADLFSAIRSKKVIGATRIVLPATRHREARIARLSVRCARFKLPLPSFHRRHRTYEIGVVMVSETTKPADGTAPIEWILLTTRNVRTAGEALDVVRAYTRRWRIEEFHRTWKRGACCIEQARLFTYERIKRWGIIMGSVAARIENIKLTARTTPDAPAEETFSKDEIEAVALLRSNGKSKANAKPTVSEVTRWLAELGGYMGSKNSPPPGATVIARGLERIETAAQLLAIQRESRKRSRKAEK